jgi:hypothetical protein
LPPSQILFAHAALTLPGKPLRHAERAGRANLGAGFATTDCDVHIGAWTMRRRRFRRRRTVSASSFTTPAFGFDLTLKPTQPLLLQGENGWSQKGPRPELASHYVSWPQLQVAGSLSLDGTPQAAKGRAWFDHEWSSEVLAAGAVGWDWIGLNLIDGGALMAFRIRDGAGATLLRPRRAARGRRPPDAVRRRRGQLHAAAALDLAAQRCPLPGGAGNPLRPAHDRNPAGAGRAGNRRAPPAAGQLLGGAGEDSRYPRRGAATSNSRAMPAH